MNAKRLAYSFIPDGIVSELRHWKHVRDLAHAVAPEESAITPLIAAGSTVLDIGANFGVFTRLFSRLVGPQGRVLSFEPVPKTYRSLALGVRVHHMGNVQPINKAVSDRLGSASMEVPHYLEGSGENLYEARIVDGPRSKKAFAVETVTVDSFGLPQVQFIKIDVEGHELEALHGSVETLRRCRPVLMVEVNSAETANFLCEEMNYAQPQVISASNQLFFPM